MRRLLLVLLAIFAVVGLVDSGYLTVRDLSGAVPPCSILEGCEQVLTSEYSHFGPVLVAALGVLFYLALLTLTVYGLFGSSVERLLVVLTSLGLVATGYFIYLQAYVIHSWCQYCLISALLVTLSWLTSLWLSRHKPRSQRLEEQSI